MGVFGVACSVLVALVLSRRGVSGRRLWLAIGLTALGPLALGPVLLSRFDLWPAALSVAALAALVYARPRLALALLGLAVAAKIYPVVLVPLALVYVARRHGRREALAAAGSARRARRMRSSVSSRCHRTECGRAWRGSSVVRFRSRAWDRACCSSRTGSGGVPLVPDWSHGSNNLVGGAAHGLALEQSVLQLGVVLAIWFAFAHGPADTDRLLVSSAAAVCAFIALGKVLSPQYLAWLLPLVPLVRGRRGLAAGSLLLAAMLLTQGWFPYRYRGLVDASDGLAVALVFSRDLVLLALLAVLLGVPAQRSEHS